MGTSDAKGKVPQDVVAIFHASFHPTKGNLIDWSLKASDDFDLDHVEFSSLPSGLHLVEQDVVYFTKDGHQGVCVFRRRQTAEHGHRGFRLSSLGILLAKSSRSRPWRHVPALKALVHDIYSSLEDRDAQDPTEDDWQPARVFFEQRKVRRADLAGAGDWTGWDTELNMGDPDILKTTPTVHLPHMLRILGPSSLTLYKHVLGRRRILIYTAPPVEAACILCHVAADICLEDQFFADGDDALPDRPKAQSRESIKVLGVVTLNDLDRLQQESNSSRGWIACTTDAIFVERPSCYDLLIDLTASGSNKATRPIFYLSKAVEPARERQPTHRLSLVRFTWSDVKLWTDLCHLMQLDSSAHDGSCCDPSSSNGGKSRPSVVSPWADIWRVYEDVCVLCAGLWMGHWRNGTTPGCSSPGENWGSIRLEGEDYLNVVRNENGGSSTPYVRNVGMGIEGRPAGPSSDPLLRSRASRRTSGMSVWTWASGKSQATTLKTINVDEDGQDLDIANRRLEVQVVTTLSLLQAFHDNTSALLGQLLTFIPPGGRSPEIPVVLTLKDVLSFELGPLSSLDHRFVEWLAEEYGDGSQIVVRKGWRDLVGLVIGFG